jgi:hypothetical protein
LESFKGTFDEPLIIPNKKYEEIALKELSKDSPLFFID